MTIDAARRTPTVPGPLSKRSFRWFFVGRAVSLFGSAMTPVALAFAVLDRSADPRWLGYVLAAQMAPMVALVVVGGGFGDRYRRDLVLRISNAGAGLSQAGVAAVVLTGARLWLLIPLAFLNGVLEAFTTPALRGIVPELVATEDVQRANSLLSTVQNASRVLGPTLAGVLAATVGGGWGIAFDAFSFLVAAACLTQVAVPAKQALSQRLLPELRAGWRYFRSLPWLWSITACFALLNAIQLGVWQVLGPAIARHSIGEGAWGAVLSVKAIGLLAFSLVMLRLTVRRPLVVGLSGFALSGVPLVLLGTRASAVWLGAAAFLAGTVTALFGILWDTTLQTRIPGELLSRVCAYDDFGSYVAIPIGQLSAVAIATAVGTGPVAVAGGIAFTVIALLPLTLRSVRAVTTVGADRPAAAAADPGGADSEAVSDSPRPSM
ncbi:MFS transporter [Kitasatospora azatica]|uniref:MFS transporter n=1 Tax=Kitasatospora azatica TaxID=58347 RepID=UPI000A010249|nr:MFS transporter [Kitasatospora azatica]